MRTPRPIPSSCVEPAGQARSVFASLYASAFDGASVSRVLPPEALSTARESIGAAQAVAGCRVAAGVTLVGCVFAAIFLPARPNREPLDRSDDHDDRAVAEAALR